MSNKVNINDRFIPSIKEPTWDIDTLSKEERNKIKDRIVVSLIHDEDEYRAILSYFHKKFPDLMDFYYGDGRKFQWRYKSFGNKITVQDSVSKKSFDMYGLVYYDSERDYEPIAIGGSYFRNIGAIRNPKTREILPGQPINKHTNTIRSGRGYRLFIDPNYRRMGLATDQWLTEAQLYRDCFVYYQRERQTHQALEVTQKMFDDPNSCYILESTSNLKFLDYIKIVMDYRDSSLIRKFNELQDNIKDFRNEAKWNFLEREGLTIDELVKPWYED